MMARVKKTVYGPARGIPGSAWRDRFYNNPQPAPDWSQDDSVLTVDTTDRMREAWDKLPDWARLEAVKRQERYGKTPVCPDCETKVITYPFAAIESYQGVRHTWCEYPEREIVSA